MVLLSERIVKLEDKVTNIINKFSLNNTRYLVEALLVATYKFELQPSTGNDQLVEKDKPNRLLAHIGDRFLKLVLAEEGYKRDSKVKMINDFTNKIESNKHLYSLKLLEVKDGIA